MILTFVFHILKTAISYAIKLLAWLLVSLSLWVPLVYTIIFVVAVGFTGGSLTQLKNWYLFGLVLSFVGSFVISAFLYERGLKKKKQERVKANLSKVTQRQENLGLTKKESLAIKPPLPVPDLNMQEGQYGQVNNANIGTNQYDQDNQTNQQNANTSDQALQNNSGRQANENQQSGYSSYGQYAASTNPSGYQENSQNSYSDYQKYGSSTNMPDYQSNQQNQPYLKTNSQKGYEDGFQSGFSAGFQSGGQANKGETARKHGFFEYNALKNNGDFANLDYDLTQNDYRSKNDCGNDYEKSRSDFTRRGGHSDDFGTGETAGFSASPLVPASSGPMPQTDYNGYGMTSSAPVSSGIISEKPAIFALYSDPTIFVYEYPDRLEYYKRTRSGMVFINTKSKNIG